MAIVYLKYCQILEKANKKLAKKTLNLWPKWRNVAQSGHTVYSRAIFNGKIGSEGR